MEADNALLDAAETVVGLLKGHDLEAVVIGAVAMAAHRYVRFTRDLDLGVNADLSRMRDIAGALHVAGFQVELREPDGDDPLGGVIDVSGPFGLLQIISFAERFPKVIEDAVRESTHVLRPGSSLRLVPIPHLVALKLYAGGLKSKADVVELLSRNPEANLGQIQALCSRYRLKGFPEVLRELQR
jgi:hypothetical protein